MESSLRTRWVRTWNALGADLAAPLTDEYAAVAARYREPHRHYHTLTHLAECLAAFDQISGLATRPAEIEAALWFHDAVYDTRAGDSESRSAMLAWHTALRLGVARDVAGRIHDLVLCTAHGAAACAEDGALIVDADLWILGAEQPRYAEYEAQVRLEYGWVDERAYRQGRTAVLAAFLAKPHIYSSAGFRQELEYRARANLQASIDSLRGNSVN